MRKWPRQPAAMLALDASPRLQKKLYAPHRHDGNCIGLAEDSTTEQHIIILHSCCSKNDFGGRRCAGLVNLQWNLHRYYARNTHFQQAFQQWPQGVKKPKQPAILQHCTQGVKSHHIMNKWACQNIQGLRLHDCTCVLDMEHHEMWQKIAWRCE